MNAQAGERLKVCGGTASRSRKGLVGHQVLAGWMMQIQAAEQVAKPLLLSARSMDFGACAAGGWLSAELLSRRGGP